jgi:hypothetical protein
MLQPRWVLYSVKRGSINCIYNLPECVIILWHQLENDYFKFCKDSSCGPISSCDSVMHGSGQRL